MKYITFAVPSYNAAEYLHRCVDTLLAGGEKVEIIIVDDGSTDDTGAIADAYAKQHPTIIKAVHQKNSGHGGAVNAGIRHATGKYFKVVDADDWVETQSLLQILEKMESWERENVNVDMLVCNYVYDHLFEKKQYPVRYRNVFPKGEICSWDKTGRFFPSQYLIMHAIIFRTAIIRKSGVKLPLHTFYVDNLFVCKPLPYVQDIFYMDINVYHYFIGREDQSVNESVMIRRIDQHIRVTKLVVDCVHNASVQSAKLARHMLRSVSIMLTVASVHLLLIGTEEALEKRKALWDYVKNMDPELYRKLRTRTLSGWTYLPNKAGNALTMFGYRISKRIGGFR